MTTYVEFVVKEEYTKQEGQTLISYATSTSGEDWYESRVKLRDNSLKVYANPETKEVFMIMRDTSPAIPSVGVALYECDDNGESITDNVPYLYDAESHRLVVDVETQKRFKFYRSFGLAYNFAEKVIDQIRINLDEVEFGDDEDIEGGWRNEMREWVRYRKSLKVELDASNVDAVLPEQPALHSQLTSLITQQPID